MYYFVCIQKFLSFSQIPSAKWYKIYVDLKELRTGNEIFVADRKREFYGDFPPLHISEIGNLSTKISFQTVSVFKKIE